MIIKDMFAEDISRDIRGVIKADQTEEEDVYQELQEYVVTRELHEHFAKFYDNYTASIDGQTDKVGVWISGFFGSGKSHFLKIRSEEHTSELQSRGHLVCRLLLEKTK